MTCAADAAVSGGEATGETDREAVSATNDRYTRKRCVLVTGCSSGIGRETARAFLAEDWLVVATARDPETVTDLEEAGCETAPLDVTQPAAVTAAVERAVDVGGAVDCVVNSAGYAQYGPLEDISTRSLHRQFDVNVYGPHRLTRAALPHMRANGSGRIVNVSSFMGRLSFAGAGAYSGSKHALEAMSDALRAEVEPFGIDVVLVEPGPVETAFARRADEELPGERTADYEDLYDLYEDARLLGGDGPLTLEPDAVAAAIVQASTCSDPPARIPVGPVSQYGSLLRFVPDRVRDAASGLLRRLA